MGIWKKQTTANEDSLSLRDKVKSILWKAGILTLFGLLLAGAGVGIGLLIAGRYNYAVQDVMFMEGVALVILGLLLSMKGNPSGVGVSSWGMQNSNAVNYVNLDVTVSERKITNYYNKFRKHAIVEFAFGRVALILGGIILATIGILFF